MVGIGLPRQAASSESISSCGGFTARRSQRYVGVARRPRNSNSASSGFGAGIWRYSSNALAHPARSTRDVDLRLWSIDWIPGKSGARYQLAYAERGRRSSRNGWRRPRRFLNHAEQTQSDGLRTDARSSASRAWPGCFLSAMLQEHKRGIGGWQAEWPIVAAVIQATGVAISSMAEAAEGLLVDPKKMMLNIEHTDGAIFSERVMMMIGAKLGRDVAHKILHAAVKKSAAEGRSLAVVLAEIPEVTIHLGPTQLKQLETPGQYLGSAHTLRKTLASEADRDDDKEQ